MGKTLNLLVAITFFSIALFLNSCTGSGSSDSEVVTSKRAGMNEVVVHISTDAQGLNPVITSGATSSQVLSQTHQFLLELDDDTYELNPTLAVKRPTVEIIEENGEKVGMVIDYEIRPEATWDNGTPITGYDYAFTLKTIKCPTVTESGPKRPYFNFINEVIVDEANPKKFKLICNEANFLWEYGSGNTVEIIPEYAYDPQGLLKNYSVKDLNDPSKIDAFKGDENLINFANTFASEKFQRDAEFVNGSGPYKLVSWETGQRIILEKKENWWGDQLEGTKQFDAYPDKIVFEIIVDMSTSLSAVRDEVIDVSRTFQSKVFVEDLQQDENFQKLYNLHTPPFIAFSYVGLNTRSPKLAEKEVRVALAHAYDVDYIIEIFTYGLAKRTNGPFHYTQSYYNDEIVPYEFDLVKAAKILEDAGWKDTDSDGIRDKMVAGAKVQLDLDFMYTPGSSTTESILLLYKNNLKEIGVNLELVTREWTVYLDELDSHNFEMYTGSWVNDPVPNDPYQLWHTESYNGGSNYCGFGDAKSDAIIEAIQNEFDDEKRKALYMELQQILHDEVPNIFTSSPLKKVVTHKRFDNAEGKSTRVGYVTNSFLLNPSFGTGAKLTQPE